MVDGFAKTPVLLKTPAASKTPRYVLKDGSQPSGPTVARSSPDCRAAVIYGFSDKPAYDVFLSTSPLALTPYPLVSGYLERQSALDAGALQLVVLDARLAGQRSVDAATFQSVLQSRQAGSDSVAVSHRLILEETATDYQIEVAADAASERSV